MEVLKQIIIFIKKHTNKFKNFKITAATKIKDNLNLDSLLIMKIAIDLEDFFKITFNPNDFNNIETLGDLVKLVIAKKQL